MRGANQTSPRGDVTRRRKINQSQRETLRKCLPEKMKPSSAIVETEIETEIENEIENELNYMKLYEKH